MRGKPLRLSQRGRKLSARAAEEEMHAPLQPLCLQRKLHAPPQELAFGSNYFEGSQADKQALGGMRQEDSLFFNSLQKDVNELFQLAVAHALHQTCPSIGGF